MAAILTPEQIEQYDTEGYVTPIQIMDAAEAQLLRANLEAAEAARGGTLEPSQRSKAHLLFKWLADLVRAPHILDAVEDLIGPNILCWTTHWFIKEPRSPSYVSWHQDNNYWGLDTKDLVSVWICLLYTSPSPRD